ncbi:MAG: hypothetical protein P8K78_04915 [Pirellulales bacterium]|nr:hypothetical protein [Pirellulales bacterium]
MAFTHAVHCGYRQLGVLLSCTFVQLMSVSGKGYKEMGTMDGWFLAARV